MLSYGKLVKTCYMLFFNFYIFYRKLSIFLLVKCIVSAAFCNTIYQCLRITVENVILNKRKQWCLNVFVFVKPKIFAIISNRVMVYVTSLKRNFIHSAFYQMRPLHGHVNKSYNYTVFHCLHSY